MGMKMLRPLIRKMIAESLDSHRIKVIDQDLSYLFQTDFQILVVKLYADDGWDLIGQMDAHVYPVTKLRRVPATFDSITSLGGDESSIVVGVYDSRIHDPKNRGRGLGRVMYEALLHEAFVEHGSFFFTSMEGTGAGTTTSDAKRVWSSLSRDFPVSGNVILIDRLPTVMGKIPTKKQID
jgi:hypothetical protein